MDGSAEKGLLSLKGWVKHADEDFESINFALNSRLVQILMETK